MIQSGDEKQKSGSPGLQAIYTMAQPNLITAEHNVRVVNEAIEHISVEPLRKKYQGGGTSSYHPGMLLKILLYAYVQRIYSSDFIYGAWKKVKTGWGLVCIAHNMRRG